MSQSGRSPHLQVRIRRAGIPWEVGGPAKGIDGDTFGPSLEVLPKVLRSETVFVVGFNNASIGVDDLRDEAPYDRVPAFESGQVHDLPYWSMRGDYDEAMALLDIVEDEFSTTK